MATTRRRSPPTVIEALLAQPDRYELFQAVRLLERAARESRPAQSMVALGHDGDPQHEAVRLRSLTSLRFPTTELAELKMEVPDETQPTPATELSVACMGLAGPTGILPEHYTELLLQRIQMRDYALRDFLDIFNHRSLSLFYRAWEKYRLPAGWERHRLEGRDDAPFTESLRCLIGLGTSGLRGRMSIEDDIPLYYSGHFSHQPRSAAGLQAILGEVLDFPGEVIQFQARWLYLDPEEQSRLWGEGRVEQFQKLGRDATVGDRVWDIRGKFRLRLGPLTYPQFRRLLPDGDLMEKVRQLSRIYVGTELDFDAQLVLPPPATPQCRLGYEDFEPRLGWNLWLGDAGQGDEHDAAIFTAADGL